MNELFIKMMLAALSTAIGLTVMSQTSFFSAALGQGDSLIATFGLSILAMIVLIPIAYSIRACRTVSKLVLRGFLWRLLAIAAVALIILPYYAARNSADAVYYDTQASIIADQIRSGSWVEIIPHAGTDMVSFVTALFYLPFGPSTAGVTFLSGLLGFVGSLCFVGAALESLPIRELRHYTIFVMMLPSVVFWSTLFGKDSWVFLGLGVTALGAAQWLKNRKTKSAAKMLLGLGIAFAFRPYVALALVLSLALTMMAGRIRTSASSLVKSIVLLALFVPIAVVMWTSVSRMTGVQQLSGDSVVDRISQQGSGTHAGGGSDVDTATEVHGVGGLIRQLPEGAARLLFRPFPWEATSVLMLAAALDNIVLIAVLIARRRNLLHTLKNIRTQPYPLFCLIFALGLSAIYSTISNLGLLMREKTQITPFLYFLAFAGEAPRPQRKSSTVSTVWRIPAPGNAVRQPRPTAGAPVFQALGNNEK